MIAIVDYGMGNIASVKNMLRHLGCTDVQLTADPEVIRVSDKIVFPGVGAFDHGMENLKKTGVINALHSAVFDQKKPLLGICLGMQLLTKGSEEGILPGLGWISAYTRKFRNHESLKVPHMGWNYVRVTNPNHLLKKEKRYKFYFVHSYYVKCEDKSNQLATCNYGLPFDCAIQQDNIYGVQFHPEKSHQYGFELFKGFLSL